jgi:hypothetical protein
MKINRDPIVIVVAALVIATLSFVGGMQVQKSLGTKNTGANASGAPGAGGGFRRGNGTFGQVSSIDGTTSMVVANSRSGANVTVSFSSSTTVTDGTGAASSIGAIQVGDTVVVTGTKAGDGSVTATSIRLNPSFGGGTPSTTTPSE